MCPKRSMRLLVLGCALALAACGDGDGGSGADAAAPDAAAGDGGPGDAVAADAALPDGGAADAEPADAAADAPGRPDAAPDTAPDGGAADVGAPCEFEGALTIPRGESRCPCEEGCDEVVSCSPDGQVMAGECLMGLTCVQATPEQATCVCSNFTDSICPPGDACPDDPDCSAAPCDVGGEPLPVGDRACDCGTDPCELVRCESGGTLFREACPQGLACIEINPTTAGCTCDEQADGFCPPACPSDPDC